MMTWKLSQQKPDALCDGPLCPLRTGKTPLAHSAKAIPNVDACETAAPMKIWSRATTITPTKASNTPTSQPTR